MKKLLLLLLLLLFPVPASATVYYVSTTGDDANDGISPSTPWKSLFKLNRTYFAAGDTILFKRGDIWAGADAAPIIPATSGSAGSPITWGAYGSGPNPVLTAATSRNKSSDWSYEGGNVWSTGGIALVGNELFPALESAAVPKWYDQCAGGGASCSATGPTTSAQEPGTVYRFAVTNHGSSTGNVQHYTSSSAPLSFTEGRYYQVTFQAKASAPFTIPDLLLRSNGADLTSGMYVKVLRVGTEWTRCSLIFRANRSTTSAGFNMLLGGSSGIPNGATLQIASLSCREIADRDFFGMYHSANLIFGSSSGTPHTGKLVQSGSLARQGEWSQSYADRKIRLYSMGNPAEHYQGDIVIVSGAPKTGFWIGGRNYHTVRDLDFFAMPSAWYGFDFTGHTIERCRAYYTGGSLMADRYDYNWGNGTVQARSGQSVGATGNIKNWTVRYNDFRQSYDTNVTWQNSEGGKKADGIWVYYNLLGEAHYNIEFWWRGAGSAMSNVYVYNNTLYDSGREWSASQRPDEPVPTMDAQIMCYNSPANGSNINIRNNIMVGGVSQMLYFSDWGQWSSVLAMDHNLYYDLPARFARASGITYATLESWRTRSQKEQASLSADPLFISRAAGDFRLGSSSPAISAGASLGLTQDLEGNPVPASRPDLGAIQSGQYALRTAVAGTGSGLVVSTPSGISCGSSCFAIFAAGTRVTLTAIPNANSIMAGWSGGGCSGTGTCSVTMDAAKNVTATFAPMRNLALSFTGSGGGSVNSSPSGIACLSGRSACSAPFAEGATVTLHAAPNGNSTFGGWSGDCQGSGPCGVSMTANRSVSASFVAAPNAKIGSTGYSSLSTACGAAGNSATILARGITFSEDVVFANGGAATLRGGYDPAFSANAGNYSVLRGSLKIRSGRLTVDRVRIR